MALAIKTQPGAGLFAQCLEVTNVKYHVYVKRGELEQALEQEQGPSAGGFGEFQGNQATRHLEGFAYFIYYRRRSKCPPLAVLNVSGVRDVSKELHYSLHLFLDRLKLDQRVVVGDIYLDNICATARLKRQIPLRALQTYLQTAVLEHEQTVLMPPPPPKTGADNTSEDGCAVVSTLVEQHRVFWSQLCVHATQVTSTGDDHHLSQWLPPVRRLQDARAHLYSRRQSGAGSGRGYCTEVANRRRSRPTSGCIDITTAYSRHRPNGNGVGHANIDNNRRIAR
jgi:hypothetical protein